MPIYWTPRDDGGYESVKCPAKHTDLERVNMVFTAVYEKGTALFRCLICEKEFSIECYTALSEEELEYERPGITSGDALKSWKDHSSNLRKKTFRSGFA
jgi:hypothetical protein